MSRLSDRQRLAISAALGELFDMHNEIISETNKPFDHIAEQQVGEILYADFPPQDCEVCNHIADLQAVLDE
jgi:hypothetical protein